MSRRTSRTFVTTVPTGKNYEEHTVLTKRTGTVSEPKDTVLLPTKPTKKEPITEETTSHIWIWVIVIIFILIIIGVIWYYYERNKLETLTTNSTTTPTPPPPPHTHTHTLLIVIIVVIVLLLIIGMVYYFESNKKKTT